MSFPLWLSLETKQRKIKSFCFMLSKTKTKKTKFHEEVVLYIVPINEVRLEKLAVSGISYFSQLVL